MTGCQRALQRGFSAFSNQGPWKYINIPPSWGCLNDGATREFEDKGNTQELLCFPTFYLFVCLWVQGCVGSYTKKGLQSFHRSSLNVCSSVERPSCTYPPLWSLQFPHGVSILTAPLSPAFSAHQEQKNWAGWKNPSTVKGRGCCLAGFHPSNFMCHQFGCVNLSELSRRLL